MASPAKFLAYLTSKWEKDLPLKNLWVVYIDDLRRVANSVANIIASTENLDGFSQWPVVNFSDDQQEQGLFLAQGVGMPTDTYETSFTSNYNMNGLRSSVFASQRANYNNLTLEFLETNIDILDHFFRPWILAAAHKGYIEDGDSDTDIKTKAYIYMYSRVNRGGHNLPPREIRNEWELRKTFVFEGIVPTNVEGDKLTYSSISDVSGLIKSVSFTFKRYYMQSNNALLDMVQGTPLQNQNQVQEVVTTVVNEQKAYQEQLQKAKASDRPAEQAAAKTTKAVTNVANSIANVVKPKQQ